MLLNIQRLVFILLTEEKHIFLLSARSDVILKYIQEI